MQDQDKPVNGEQEPGQESPAEKESREAIEETGETIRDEIGKLGDTADDPTD